MEHDQDAVPKLEGRDNPGTANWTSITTDDPGEHTLRDAHGIANYRETMRSMDEGGLPVDASVEAFKDENSIFMSDEKVSKGDGTEFVIDHEVP